MAIRKPIGEERFPSRPEEAGMFQERHKLGGCGHPRALDALGCALHRRRAKWVGFVAALQETPDRAAAGAAGRLSTRKNDAE